ncbi:MAG: hypothetical protein ACE5H0_14185 [Bacteroidota bacterium]
MAEVMLPLHESQVIELTRQLSLTGKQAVLQTLIPGLGRFEALVDYGGERIRALCRERGIDWDGLPEEEREQLIDDLLHEEE